MSSRDGGGGNISGSNNNSRHRRGRDDDEDDIYDDDRIHEGRRHLPQRLPKKSRPSNIRNNNNTSFGGDHNEGGGDDDMDPVAQARRALEMYHEVSGEGLDGTDDDDDDENDGNHPDGGVVSNGTDLVGKERPSVNGDPIKGTSSDKVEMISPEEEAKRKKERQEEEAKLLKRKEDGEAQRRAFRPSIATIQDSSCLL